MNDILIKVGADISDFSRKMAEGQRSLETFTKNNKQTFDSFRKVGAVATGMGIAIAGGLGFAVKTAAQFESGMSEVAAISGATGKDFDLLSEKAREMGSKTSFSATESAEGLKYMALAGWNTQQMMSGLEPILHLAEAGSLDLGRASDLVTDSMATLGLESKDLVGYLDKVASTASNSNTDIDALMEAMVVAGGTFSRFNVPLEEANAFLGILANRGTKGSEAGTALNAIMDRLTSGTGQAAKALDEIGISAFDSGGNFRGMETVMYDVKGALEKMDDEQQAHYISMLAGLNHGKSFQKMLDGLGGEYQELKGDISDSNGALEKMRDIMKDNLQGALENLNSAFEEMMIAIGTALLPAVKELTSWLQSLADWFNGLDESTQSTIAIVAALTAGVLILGGGLLLLIGFIPAIVAGFGALATVLGAISWPIVAIIAGIAALAAGLIYAWETSETFREVVSAAFEAVQTVVMTVIDAVVAFVMDIWGQLVEFWIEHGQMILEASQNVWNTIWEVISVAMMGIWEVLKVAWDLIVEVVTIAWDLISGVISGSIDVILGIINTFSALFTGDWDELWVGIQEILSGAWDIIATIFTESLRLIFTIIDKGMDLIIEVVVTIFTTMWQFIQTIFGLVVDYIQFAWDNAVRIVSEKAAEILKWVIIKFTEVKTTVTEVLSAVASIIRDKFQEGLTTVITKATSMYTTVRDKFNEIKTAVTDKMTQVKDQISDKFQEGVNIVRTKLAEMWLTVTEKFASIYTAVLDKMGQVKQTIEDMWNKAVDFLKEIDLFQIGEDIINGLKDGIKSKAEDVGTAIKGVADTITGKITGALGIFSPSRVLKKIGVHTGEGLELGIASMAGRVGKAAQGLAEAAVVSPPKVDVGYSTPGGVRSSVSSAINGTMDVTSSRDSAILAKMDEQTAELRKQHQMIIELDGQRVGEAVTPHVNGKNAIDSTVRRYF